MPQGYDEKDDFWTIDKIIPKKHTSKFSQSQRDTSCTYLEFGEDKPQSSMTAKALNSNMSFETNVPSGSFPEAKDPSESYSYTPSNPLLTCVTVRPRSSPARFYADFLQDAERYADKQGRMCKYVPFPAYVPEYRAMKKSQLDFYFYFRDCAKAGVKIETSLSYILLFLFEIINLPHIIKPAEGVEYMCRAWLLYRSEYPKLDSYISEWLCDYCLIHRLDIPDSVKKYRKYLGSLSSLPEFYSDPETTDRYTFMTVSAGYKPDIQKYPAVYELLKTHLMPALDCIAHQRKEPSFSPEKMLSLTTGAKSSYRSALCAYSNNALISYTVRSFTKSAVTREKLADLIKYCENKARAYAGIRARLKCPSVGELERSLLDSYFDKNLPIMRKRYVRPAQTETENLEFAHLYEPESIGISPETALSIEERSWKAAFMLEGAFTDAESSAEMSVVAERMSEDTSLSESRADDTVGTLDKTERAFLSLICAGKYTELKEFIKQNGLIEDALAEKINVFAFDSIGDSVLEYDGENYAVIPDYKEEAEKWILN